VEAVNMQNWTLHSIDKWYVSMVSYTIYIMNKYILSAYPWDYWRSI